MLSPFLRGCLPGELVEESVPLTRHWSGRRRRPWHHPQVCRGQGIGSSKNRSVKSDADYVCWHSAYVFSSGWSQHDRVGQRCDRQRRPSLRHRSASHSRGRSNPETFTRPLRRPITSVLYPPISATQHSSHQSGHFFWVGGQGSESDWEGEQARIIISSTRVKLHCASTKNSCKTSSLSCSDFLPNSSRKELSWFHICKHSRTMNYVTIFLLFEINDHVTKIANGAWV